MADTTNNYVIAVTDGVASSIQPRLQAIGDAAMSAGSGCNSLQQSLNKLDASGITSAVSALRSANTAVGNLSSGASQYARGAGIASTNTAKLSGALVTLVQTAGAAAAQMRALSQAVASFNQGSNQVTTAAKSAASAQSSLGGGANAAAGGVRNMNAALGLARGNITSANRLAGSFLSTLIGSGPVVQAAFSALGAIALVAVLVEMGQAIYHVVEAYKAMELASAQASIQAIEDGQKIVKVHAAIFTATQAARLVSGRLPDVSEVSVTQVAPLVQEAAALREIASAQRGLNEAGLTGAALQKKRQADMQADQQDLIKQRDAIQSVADALKAQRLEQAAPVGVVGSMARGAITSVGGPVGQLVDAYMEAHPADNKVTDPKQIADIEKNFTSATEEVKRLNTQITVMGINAKAAGVKEVADHLKDGAKAATAEMKRLNDELAKLKEGGSVVTAAQQLAFWNKNRNNLPGNEIFARDIDAKAGGDAQTVDRQNATVKEMVGRQNEQVAAITSYGDARKIQLAVDKDVDALNKQFIVISPQLLSIITENNRLIVEGAVYQKELNSAYEAARSPLQTYVAAQQALQDLLTSDPEHQVQYLDDLYFAGEAYKKATVPLYEYNKGIEDQTSLLYKYGSALDQARLKLQLEKDLEAQHIDPNSARGQAEVSKGLASGKQLSHEEKVSTAVGNYQRDTTQTDNYNVQVEALQKAKLSMDEYRTAAAQLVVQKANLDIAMGNTNWKDPIISALGELTAGFKGFTAGATAALGNFYKTLDSGFADSVGRAIVYSQDLGKSLMDVARQGVSTLISALIKLGIEYLLTSKLAQALGIHMPKATDSKDTAKNAAVSIAAIGAVTTAQLAAFKLLEPDAWSLAEAVSLASFGANAIAAGAGIAAIKTAAGFKAGGYVSGPGSATSDSVPARLSNGEYVVNARATRENYGIIDAINNGQKLSHFAQGGYVGGIRQSATSGPMAIEVHNYAGVQIQTEQVSEGRVRLIVGEMTPGLVAKHAPTAVASSIDDPNGHVSKSIKRNVTPERVR